MSDLADSKSVSTVYLDHHASTPCDRRVLDAMLPFFSERFGNPSSTLNAFGRAAADAVCRARASMAEVLAVPPRSIVFTSGATESNNLALIGLCRHASDERRHLVTTAIEHKSVLEAIRAVVEEDFEVSILPVGPDGRLNLDELRATVTDRTLAVSIQAANNEIGTIQDIAAVCDISHTRGALVHCDAAQALGHDSRDFEEADLVSLSAHKIYGPKGVGALIVRDGVSSTPISPIQFGGGQEFGLRPGTVNVPGVIGFAKALELVSPGDAARIRRLRDMLEQRLLESIPGLSVNGAKTHRLPSNLNLTFSGIDAETLIANVPELALSTGSACTNGAPDPSHVLTAIGLSRLDALCTIRIGLGRGTAQSDVELAAERLILAARLLRAKVGGSAP